VNYNKVLVCPDRYIWYISSLQDPEDPIHSSYNKRRSHGSVRVSPAFQHCNRTMPEILLPHHMQCSWWRPSPCSCCCRFVSLHQTSRKTQPHVAQSHFNQIRDHWTLVLPMHGSRQALENTGFHLSVNLSLTLAFTVSYFICIDTPFQFLLTLICLIIHHTVWHSARDSTDCCCFWCCAVWLQLVRSG